MSLILDALRKMEQERKAKQGAAQDLRPEVLRYRSRIEPKRGRLPVLVSLFLVAVAVGAASFYIGKRDAGKYQLQHQAFQEPGPPATSSLPPAPLSPVEAGPTAPLQQPSAALPPVAESVPASPLSSRTGAATDVAPSGVRGGEAVDSFIPVTSTSRTKQGATAAANRSSATLLEAEKAAAAKHAQVPVQEARARRREATEVEQSAPADITISGIAYQDERHLRRAVVNGTLVREGEEIAGARVVEIKEHKVRMSRGGKLFEVPFGAGGR